MFIQAVKCGGIHFQKLPATANKDRQKMYASWKQQEKFNKQNNPLKLKIFANCWF